MVTFWGVAPSASYITIRQQGTNDLSVYLSPLLPSLTLSLSLSFSLSLSISLFRSLSLSLSLSLYPSLSLSRISLSLSPPPQQCLSAPLSFLCPYLCPSLSLFLSYTNTPTHTYTHTHTLNKKTFSHWLPKYARRNVWTRSHPISFISFDILTA